MQIKTVAKLYLDGLPTTSYLIKLLNHTVALHLFLMCVCVLCSPLNIHSLSSYVSA